MKELAKRCVGECFTQYLKCQSLADSSKAIKSRAVKFFIKLHGDMDVVEISFGECEDYKNSLQVTGRGKKRKPGAANTYLRNIKPLFSWMFKRGYIERNPFCELQLFREDSVMLKPYEPQEIERMYSVANLHWKVIIVLGLLSLRRGEVMNLTVSDIDFGNNCIRIMPKSETDKTWDWQIKNHVQSIVPFPEFIQLAQTQVSVHSLLWEQITATDNAEKGQPYVCILPKHYRRMMERKAAGELDFVSRGLADRSFSRSFANILKRAAVKPRRFHDLRGTFATNMINNGMKLNETKTLMRHSSVQTTEKYYVHVDKQKLVARSAKLCSNCYVT